MTMGPVNIGFKIAKCSSEDDDAPATNLMEPGPGSLGWQSSQYCIYPQVTELFDYVVEVEVTNGMSEGFCTYKFLTLRIENMVALRRLTVSMQGSNIPL